MKQQSNLEKKVRRRIAKASKRGRYLTVTRRGRRDRPERKKKGIRCNSCSNILAKYHNFGLCDSCLSKNENKIISMRIPKMTEK